ncbi:MAG: hypothetical protein IJ717_12720 [Treponema sp.]|nr:hypothetical protein [Treponema sp.]
MNSELRELLIELLKRGDDICDEDRFYLTEFENLMDMLDEILSNDPDYVPIEIPSDDEFDWLPEDEKSADGKKPGLRIY